MMAPEGIQPTFSATVDWLRWPVRLRGVITRSLPVSFPGPPDRASGPSVPKGLPPPLPGLPGSCDWPPSSTSAGAGFGAAGVAGRRVGGRRHGGDTLRLCRRNRSGPFRPIG